MRIGTPFRNSVFSGDAGGAGWRPSHAASTDETPGRLMMVVAGEGAFAV